VSTTIVLASVVVSFTKGELLVPLAELDTSIGSMPLTPVNEIAEATIEPLLTSVIDTVFVPVGGLTKYQSSATALPPEPIDASLVKL